MKKTSQVSPMMMEILVVTLFLALSASVLVQLIAKARDISVAATQKGHALILVQDALERAKADPAGDGAFDEQGRRAFTLARDGLTVDCTITRADSNGGAYYAITASAFDGGKPIATLDTGRYVPDAEVSP